MSDELFFLMMLGTLGASAGFLSGLSSTGPGLIIVPFLTIIYTFTGLPFGTAAEAAFLTSLTSVFMIFLVSAITHFKLRHFSESATALLFLGALPGAVFGLQIGRVPHSTFLLFIIGCALAVSGGTLLIRGDTPAHLYAEERFGPKLTIREGIDIFAIGIFTGVISSVVGVSGAIVAVPLQALAGVAVHKAVHNTCLISLASCLIGLAAFFYAEQFNAETFRAVALSTFRDGAALALGGMAGAFIGVQFGSRMLKDHVNKVVGEMYVAIGGILVLQQIVLWGR